MIIFLFALIALGSICVYGGPDSDDAENGPAPRSTPVPERVSPALQSAERATLRRRRDLAERAAPTVVSDLSDHRLGDDLLVLQYDPRGPRPDLTLKHDETAGVSRLFADGRLVLRVHNVPGDRKLRLDEIVMDGAQPT